tara:strand:+ start:471 stop:734 length:264 start_codon:yes stop_codon:yes gene_type:complete
VSGALLGEVRGARGETVEAAATLAARWARAAAVVGRAAVGWATVAVRAAARAVRAARAVVAVQSEASVRDVWDRERRPRWQLRRVLR